MARNVRQGQGLCPIQIVKQSEESVCMENSTKEYSLGSIFGIRRKAFGQYLF